MSIGNDLADITPTHKNYPAQLALEKYIYWIQIMALQSEPQYKDYTFFQRVINQLNTKRSETAYKTWVSPKLIHNVTSWFWVGG
jgi:hypothetical protein